MLCSLLIATTGAGERVSDSQPAILLVDETRHPHVAISWQQTDGTEITLESDLPYTSKNERKQMGHNVELFACVGGTRLDKGAGHPKGLILRAGVYKTENSRPMFEAIKAGTDVTMTLKGIYFNQPAVPDSTRVLQHLQYTLADVASCGLGEGAMDQYNTVDPRDNLYGKILDENARFGVLSGDKPGGGKVEIKSETDGSVTLVVTTPYALFRHVRDPWMRATPGSFFEPYHFHLEIEVLPVGVEPRPFEIPKDPNRN